MKLFNFMSKQIRDSKKREMLNYLQCLSDENIERLGFSITLVHQGIDAWPWRVDNRTDALTKIDQMLVVEQRNIAELKSYTDAELLDLGISRGQIKHAVRHGRVGIDDTATAKVA